MKNKLKVHFSNKSNEWTTPQSLYEKLNKEFDFTLDPCCTKQSAKCVKYYTQEDNGLIQKRNQICLERTGNICGPKTSFNFTASLCHSLT